jgi:hypothetical protein
VAVPALVLLVLMLTVGLAAACARIRCVDAAHAGARAAARGEPGPVVVAAAGQLAPDGAATRVETGPGHVRVRVEAVVRGPGRLLSGLRFTVSGTAVAAREPGEVP